MQDQSTLRRRDAYISTRRQDLVEGLKAKGDLPPADAARFGDLARLLSAVLHYEAYDVLERLKALYAPLDPDTAPSQGATDSGSFQAFEAGFIDALHKGNYAEIAHDSEISARATRELTGLNIKCSPAGIRSVRFFARGMRTRIVERKTWFGLVRRTIETESYDEVVVLVAFKSMQEIDKADRKAFARARHGVRPAAALIKHFRNVARAELLTLHPGARPSMRARDQVMLAAPALVGGVPIALQIVPAVTVLFTVIALYFGARGAIDNSQLQRALAAASGLIAVGAFVMRQWMKYERQTLKYQKQLADTVYFRNLANNSAVLDALIGAGEDQDAKEALLGYWALLRAQRPLSKEEIDAAIEEFLRAHFSLDINFQIGDALAKLVRFGLVAQSGATFSAVPMDSALAALDTAWDAYFKYGRIAAE